MFQTFYIMSHWNTRNHTKITLKYKLYWTFFSADGQERGYLLLHRWGQRSPSQNCDRAWFSAPDPGVTAKNDSSVNISYKTMTPLRNSGGARAILHGGKLGPDQIHGGQMWLCNWDDSANRADVWGQSEGKLNFRGGGANAPLSSLGAITAQEMLTPLVDKVFSVRNGIFSLQNT